MKALRSLVRWTKRSIFGVREAAPTNAQLVRAALIRGDAARNRKNWPDVAAAYGEVLQIDPTRVDIWVQYGHALKEQGLLTEAVSAYRRATQAAPGEVDPWVQTAHTLKAAGDQAGAIRAFREILFIDPGHADARDELIQAGARAEIPETAYGQAAASLESARLTRGLIQWSGELGRLTTASSFPQGDHDSFRRQYPIQPPPPHAPSRLIVRVAASGSPAMLRATLTSLMDQRHQDWTAVVDAPPSVADHSIGSFAHIDPRIRFEEPEPETSTAPVVLLVAGTVLDREALGWLDFALGRTGAAAVYCDHDRYTEDGRIGPVRHSPQLQSMFDTHDLASTPAPPATVILRAAPDVGASIAEALSTASALGPIAHLPRMLVSIPDATPTKTDLPLSRGDEGGSSILVIIPTRDEHEMLQRCVESLISKAADPGRVKVLIVDNRSTAPETAATLSAMAERGLATSLIMDEPFNWSRCNNVASAQATEDILVFANNDIEMLTEGWDTWIAGWLAQPDVGVVGPRMLYPDGSLQHGSILLGAWNGLPFHDGLWAEPRSGGPLGRWRRSHAAAAVTGAFLACRRDTFQKVGGFDERLAIAYNDVDFCLKVRTLGLKVLYAGEIELIHYESRTRGQNDSADKVAWDNAELADMHARWGRHLAQDPSYNPQWTSAMFRPYDAVHDLALSAVLAHLDASARPNPWAIDLG